MEIIDPDDIELPVTTMAALTVQVVTSKKLALFSKCIVQHMPKKIAARVLPQRPRAIVMIEGQNGCIGQGSVMIISRSVWQVIMKI